MIRGRVLAGALFVAVGTALTTVPLASGGATFITVEADGQNQFGPAEVATSVGVANLAWRWGAAGTTTNQHNVRQDDKLFYSGSLSSARENFVVSVSAGEWPYYCEAHGGPGTGMAGTVDVAPTSDGIPTEDTVPIRWAVAESTTGDQYDVRFRVDGGDWRAWKQNTGKQRGVFGKGDNPANYSVTKLYEVQVRSEKSANPKRRSDWSRSFVFGDTPG